MIECDKPLRSEGGWMDGCLKRLSKNQECLLVMPGRRSGVVVVEATTRCRPEDHAPGGSTAAKST